MGTDFRAIAPDKDAPQISPFIGIYQDGFGSAISGGGRDVLSLLDDRDQTLRSSGSANDTALRLAQKDAEEKQNKISLAAGYRDILDTAIQGAEETLGINEKPLGPADLATLSKAERDIQLGKIADAQNPKSSLQALRQSANLRRLIVENPYIADELIRGYTNIADVGIVEQLDDITENVEKTQAAQTKAIMEEGIKLGYTYDTPIQEVMKAVSKQNALTAQAERARAEMDILSRNNALDIQTWNEYHTESLIPEMLNAARQDFGVAQNKLGDPKTMDSEELARVTQAIRDKGRVRRAAIAQSAPANATAADMERVYAPIQAEEDAAIAYYSGEYSLAAYKAADAIGTAKARDVLMRDNPELYNVEQLAESISKFPDTYHRSLLELDGARYGARVLGYSLAKSSNRDLTHELNRDLATARTPQERKNIIKENNLALQLVAANSTPEEYVRVLSNVFGQYSNDREMRNYAQAVDGMLEDISSPESLAKIRAGQGAEQQATLLKGMERYTNDVLQSARAEIEKNTSGTDVNWGEIFKGGIAVRDTGPLLNSPKSYLETTYMSSGLPVWKVKEGTPASFADDAQIAANTLNKIGPRLVRLYKVHEAMGSTGKMSPPDFVKLILEEGKLPAQIIGEQRNQTPPS